MEKYTNELVTLILGSDIPKYDGLALKSSYRNSHIGSIICLTEQLRKEGFDIGFFDKTVAEEAAFNLITNGHIVFFNLNNTIGFLKLPKSLTKRQLEILKLMEEELKDMIVFEQTINPNSKEEMTSKEYQKNYKFIPNNYKIKEV